MRNPVFPKVDDNIPSYIKEEYPKFHQMVVDYFKWLETDRNFLQLLVDFKDNFDVDNQIKPYINFIKKELGWYYETPLKVDDRTLIKILREFYLSRGNVKSFETLFRLLFNEKVKITYPRDRLLKLSDNNYVIEHRILTSANNINNANFKALQNEEILSVSIAGQKSGVVLVVDKIIPIILNKSNYLIIIVSETLNDFIPFEQVKLFSEGIEPVFEIVYSATKLEILDRGYGYKAGEEIEIIDTLVPGTQFYKGGPHVPGKIIIKKVSSGGIDKIGIVKTLEYNPTTQKTDTIFSSGLNYKNNDIVKVKSGQGNGWGFDARVVVQKIEKAKVNFNIADGVIKTISLTNHGVGYINPPNIKVVDNRPIQFGSGAILKANEINRNFVGDVRVAYKGNNYSFPTVTFSAPNGETAVGTATMSDLGNYKIVNDITISNGGGGYITPPKVTFSAPTGIPSPFDPEENFIPTVAKGSAVLTNGVVTDVIITNPGAGYLAAPTVTFSAPTKVSAEGVVKLSGSAVDGVFITNSGAGYKTATVTFSAPSSGTLATGSVVIENGIVKLVNITVAGNGYSQPSVTFSAPPSGGTSAEAIAVVGNGRIEKLIITNKGSGYINPPTITINQGGNVSASATPILMGELTDIEVIDGGRDYDLNYIQLDIDPPISDQSIAVKPVYNITLKDGVIVDLVVSSPGKGYSVIPNYTISDFGSGVGFLMTISLQDSGIILNGFDGGESYSNNTKISLENPIDVGKISYIDVLNPGYNFQNIEDIVLEIISESGNIGTPAEIYPISTSIGRIEEIEEIEDYWYYDEGINIPNPTVNIKSEFGTKALLNVNKKTCINKRIRHNENLVGLLGHNAFLHDSYYYQQFSYEVQSKVPTLYSKEIIDDLLHPVGFMKFNILYDDSSHYMNSLVLAGENKITINKNLNIFLSNLNVILPLFESHYFEIKENLQYFETLFSLQNKLITFDINTVEDVIFNNNFNLDLDYFKNYELNKFTGEKEISELAALDFYMTTFVDFTNVWNSSVDAYPSFLVPVTKTFEPYYVIDDIKIIKGVIGGTISGGIAYLDIPLPTGTTSGIAYVCSVYYKSNSRISRIWCHDSIGPNATPEVALSNNNEWQRAENIFTTTTSGKVRFHLGFGDGLIGDIVYFTAPKIRRLN